MLTEPIRSFKYDVYFTLFVPLIIAVYLYRSVMISIDLSETAQKQKAHWKSETTSETNFLLTKESFSQTEFCLRLHTAVVFHMQSFNCGMYIPLSDDKHGFV